MEAALASLGRSLCRYHSLAPITYSVGERIHSTFTYAPTRKHERLAPAQTSGHVRGFSVQPAYDLRPPPVAAAVPMTTLRPPPASVVSTTTAYDKAAFSDGGEGSLSQVGALRTHNSDTYLMHLLRKFYVTTYIASSLQ